MKIRVINDHYQTHHEHRGGTGQYEGFTETAYSNRVRGLVAVTQTKNGRSEWYDFETDLDVNVGDEVYLVYVIYSTGSTFGRAEGMIKFIDIFTDKDEARALEEAIYRQNDRDIIMYINSGVEKECYCSWNGYFEALQSAEAERFEIFDQEYAEMKGWS